MSDSHAVTNNDSTPEHSATPLGVSGHAGYAAYHPKPQHRIELLKRHEDAEGKITYTRSAVIRGVMGWYYTPDGMIRVRFRGDHQSRDHPHFDIDLERLHRAGTWGPVVQAGHIHKRNVEAAVATVEGIIHATQPLQSNPDITEHSPPHAPRLAPRRNTPADREPAREAWAHLGNLLTPTGRLALGAFIAAPWLHTIGAANTALSLVGDGGSGKTLALTAMGALFGNPDLGAVHGLVSSADGTARGISAAAADRGYLPIGLDEIVSNQRPAEVLTSLVMGANRTRATRAGSAATNPATWRSLVVVTTNYTLTGDLDHEMWARRHIEINTTRTPLWQAPEGAEPDWSDIAETIDTGAGWPWWEITQRYGPGPRAQAMTDRIKALPKPLGGKLGSIGAVLQAALAGAEVMADYTGNGTWTQGVWDAALTIAATAADVTTPQWQVWAGAIVEAQATEPGSWLTGDPLHDQPLRGITAEADTAHTGTCTVSHTGTCEWWHILSGPLQIIMGTSNRALATTPIMGAIQRSPKPPHISRRETITGAGRQRVVKMCLTGLAHLADQSNGTGGVSTATDPFSGQRRTPEPTPAPAPEAAPEAAPGALRVGWAPSLVAAMMTGEGGDYDQIVTTPRTLNDGQPAYKDQLEAGGWDTHGWSGGSDSVMATHTATGAKVRFFFESDPEGYAEALRDFPTVNDGHPVKMTPAGSAIAALKHIARNTRARDPRWVLDPGPAAVFDRTRKGGHPYHYASGWTAPGVDKKDAGFQWDRNKAHLSAFGTAVLAPLWAGEDYHHYTGADLPADPLKMAGQWLIEVPVWEYPAMPSPLGDRAPAPGTPVWVTTDIMRLYHGEVGLQPVVLEAWLAPAHRVAPLAAWAERTKQELAKPKRPAHRILKAQYQQLAGKFARAEGATAKGVVRAYRPDWWAAITSNSWANVWRAVWREFQKTGRTPTRLNVDALYYADPEPPSTITIGTGLGEYKAEGR